MVATIAKYIPDTATLHLHAIIFGQAFIKRTIPGSLTADCRMGAIAKVVIRFSGDKPLPSRIDKMFGSSTVRSLSG